MSTSAHPTPRPAAPAGGSATAPKISRHKSFPLIWVVPATVPDPEARLIVTAALELTMFP